MLRLEGLSVQGFKSFADRTDLVIPDRITCIVGPNGCGKSNVLDAVAWVLGEQSPRHLRGSRMEDFIFAGSRSRKPAGMAEVSLHFAPRPGSLPAAAPADGGVGAALPADPPDADEPADLDETGNETEDEDDAEASRRRASQELDPRLQRPVVVTRRLYRNGDSEYLIDGQRARLKDIQQLIMGTGMGTRVYSIIEQGRVDQILNSKPTDRRVLIEEAAGITRYKLKRKAARLKLDESEQSLLRVTDIITELDKQLRSLRRQANTAKRYRTLSGRRRIVLQAWHAGRHAELAASLGSVQLECDDLHASEARGTDQLAELEAYEAATRGRVAELESARDQASAEAHAVDLALERARNQVASARQRLSDLDAQDVRRTTAVEAILAELSAAAERRAAAQASAERLEADLASSRTALDATSAGAQAVRQRLSDVHRTIAETKEDIFEVMSEAAGLRNRKSEVEMARQRLAAQVARLAGELATAEAQAADARKAVTAAETSLSEALEAEERERKRLAASVAKLEDLGRDIEARRTEHAVVRAELDEVRSQHAAVTETVRTHAAFADGVRRLLQARPDGLCGTVADHVTVRPGDELACEKALGPWLQAVAFESAATAEAAAREICGTTAPEALMVFPGGRPAEASSRPSDSRVLGAISESLRFSPSVPWMSHVVPVAWLVATAADAFELFRRHPDQTFVSRDGVVAGPAGRASAGRPRGEGEGILETKTRHGRLAESLTSLKERSQAIEAALGSLESARATASVQRDEGLAAAAAAERESLSRRHGVASLRQTSDAAEAKRDALRYQHDTIAEELADAERRLGETDASLSASATRHAELDRRLATAQQDATRLEGESEGADAALSRLREELAVKGERRAAAGDELARVEREAAAVEERNRALATEAEALAVQYEEVKGQHGEAERAVEAGAERWESLRSDLASLEDRLRASRASFVEGSERLRELRAEHDRVQKAVSEADIRRERLASDLAHLVQDCVKDLGVEPDALPLPIPPPPGAEEKPTRSRRQAAQAVAEASGSVDDVDAGMDDGAAAALSGLDAAGEAPGADEVEEREEAPSTELPWSDGVLDLPKLAAEAERLHRRIERIGPVNLVAISDYEELSKRHGFLAAERNDLLESIRSLRETIAEIDQISRERFVAAFEAVAVEFNLAFQTLFRGGRGELRLQDEDDPLECGIEIIAQPPGKRLQNMMLLSGGEKALSAIALLFALFRYKPSPFCVLDEVDAPLDETNVVRFIELVSRMATDTQFVVITHNRRTMERADVLYGVTMEEPGCSKLVSVSFQSLKEHPAA